MKIYTYSEARQNLATLLEEPRDQAKSASAGATEKALSFVPSNHHAPLSMSKAPTSG